jgi:hypothetical protein
MNLTHETTESDLMAPVRAARRALAAKASWVGPGGEDDVADSDTLLSLVHEIKAEEAVASLRNQVVDVLAAQEKGALNGTLAEALNSVFVRVLTVGADDAWSGYKNDARRQAFEAVRREVSDLRWKFPRG